MAATRSHNCPIERLQVNPSDGPWLIVRVLGPLAIHDTERTLGPRELGGARPKQVLEMLLSARGRSVPAARLAELLWGDHPPRDASASLHTFISVLRRHLVGDRNLSRQLVVTEPEAYRFATDLILFDLDRFDELVEASARQPTREARASLETALDLVRGDVFEDEPYAAWATDIRGSYRGRVLGARLDAADLALAELDFPGALLHAQQALPLDVFSERAHRSQMLALYALGRGHESLELYRVFQQRLDEQLGLRTTPETRELEAAILRNVDVRMLLPRPLSAAPSLGDGRSTPLLGRGTELDRLERAVSDSIAGGGGLIEIKSDSGVGKTRLLDELQRHVRDARVGRSGGSEVESHLRYVPLASALRQALRDVDLDAARSSALGHILPELAVGGRPQTEELEALEALVRIVSEHAPVVLLIDDVQWADRHTVAALGYLRRRAPATGCTIVIARRETAEEYPSRRLRPDVVVDLEPLSPEELQPLGIDGLHERTGGVPRFVVEELEHGRHTEPSPSVTEALLAHCRAEGDRAFRVLVAASFFEEPFGPESLAALIDTDVTELTEQLERLCERRILRVEGIRFRFRYDVCRRALGATMSPARRRLLERRLDCGSPTSSAA